VQNATKAGKINTAQMKIGASTDENQHGTDSGNRTRNIKSASLCAHDECTKDAIECYGVNEGYRKQ
jgi:hypothetical protein